MNSLVKLKYRIYCVLRDFSFKILPHRVVSIVKQLKVPGYLKEKVSSMKFSHNGDLLGKKHYYLLPCLSQRSIVYSFGVGQDASFELLINDIAGAQIWMFDPTPIAIKFYNEKSWPPNMFFMAIGCEDYDGEANFFESTTASISRSIINHQGTCDECLLLPVKRIPTIMKILGHEKLDVLKLDVEGSEYGVLNDLLKCGIEVGQIVTEFHDRFYGAGYQKTIKTLDALKNSGYSILWNNLNHQEMTFVHSSVINNL